MITDQDKQTFLSKYRISDRQFLKKYRTIDIALRIQSIGKSDIGLTKKMLMPTSEEKFFWVDAGSFPTLKPTLTCSVVEQVCLSYPLTAALEKISAESCPLPTRVKL